MNATYLSSLSKEDLKRFVDSFDTVLTDCDGVLWVENNAIEGSPEVLKKLRELGKKVFYVTNNSTKDRKDYVSKCLKLNYQATEEEIVSTAYLVANYLKSINFRKKAFLIGSAGFAKELDLAGVKYVGFGPDPMPEGLTTLGSLEGGLESLLEPDVGAVLLGFDPHFSYPKMVKAASYLSDPNCLYIVTNTDERFPVSSRLIYPGTGSMVAAISACAARDPLVVGKPNPYVAEAVSKIHPLDPKRTLMIGDRANSDVLLGANCGFRTLLVLTGVTSLDDVDKWKKSSDPEDKKLIPDFYLNKLGDFLQLL
ncbi:hypothetical protein J437_LFUL010804 [Ladona fulva]|uniref:Phosphoglycolate phosphatase n=1 Tax=Ladona fulva TaxID=123851 RepID=A0A8K0KRW6_LADFU|nr:hypothetical protein J437_LFUL010804 [Ladona fulva]